MLKKIPNDFLLECPGFRVLCPTRWTVLHWTAINSAWTISLAGKLDPEMRGTITGVQAEMVKFDYFFSINILKILLRNIDNLFKIL